MTTQLPEVGERDRFEFSGTAAHQSNLSSGSHQHYFGYAWATLSVSTGDVLFAYVYLDPANIPLELMLQWNDGSWEHRAYWGANNILNGTDGTTNRFHAGPLPAAAGSHCRRASACCTFRTPHRIALGSDRAVLRFCYWRRRWSLSW